MALPDETEHTARHVVDAAVKIHSALGPGLLESVYEKCLGIELAQRGIGYERQVAVPITYEGVKVELGLRLGLKLDRPEYSLAPLPQAKTSASDGPPNLMEWRQGIKSEAAYARRYR